MSPPRGLRLHGRSGTGRHDVQLRLGNRRRRPWRGDHRLAARRVHELPSHGGYGGSEYNNYEYLGGIGGDGVQDTNSVVYLQQCSCTGGPGGANEPVPLDLSLHGRFLDVATRPDMGVGRGPVIDIGAYEARVPRLIGRWRRHP